MNNLHINRLHSGGIITNYNCSSQCRHCLYACSPNRDKSYIQPEVARELFKKVKSLGCNSVHIGGGEPMLNVSLLEKVIEIATQEQIKIEYVETNSSWYNDHEKAVGMLTALNMKGLNTLLVSISPFHNEAVPFRKVKGVLDACREAGVSIFAWVQDFYSDIDSFDEDTTHSLEEYVQKFGENYLKKIPYRYWIHYGGRAIEMFKKMHPLISTNKILDQAQPCTELAGTSHFHFDLYKNFVPGLCSGLVIHAEDIGAELSYEKYPIISMLYNEGVKSLYRLAVEKHKFEAQAEYLSKCHLCLDIRKFLVLNKQIESIELQPVEFYKEIN